MSGWLFALLTSLGAIALPLVAKVLVGLGFGVVSFVGLDLVFSNITQWIFSEFEGLGSDIFSILVLAGMDQGINIITSSYVAGLTIASVGAGGTLKKVKLT